MKILGVVLILAGIVALAYGGFSFTTHKKAMDMGPIQIERAKTHSFPVPPVLGAAGVVLGGVLLFMGGRK
jgi:hypothetical protein